MNSFVKSGFLLLGGLVLGSVAALRAARKAKHSKDYILKQMIWSGGDFDGDQVILIDSESIN